MPREFSVPEFYRSSLISRIKTARRSADPGKRDYSPALLDLCGLRFKIARQFGFCFGVENAIEIAYRAVDENPGRRVFLLGEMIHNPHVNEDLRRRGVKFILSSQATEIISFESLTPEDLVIIPAFGTTVELLDRLMARGVRPELYDATCPFVEKVWRRARQLGEQGFTIVIHGKHAHEETRATFSRAALAGPSIVVRDRQEAEALAGFVSGSGVRGDFECLFGKCCSVGFDFDRDLGRIGVVNQTTMLAEETAFIADTLRQALKTRFGESEGIARFADTRDTLCYATTENQEAVRGMLASGGALAIIVGGYNSSNTGHLAELCHQRLPTYHIKDAEEVLGAAEIRHRCVESGEIKTSRDWLPAAAQVDVLVSAGASCPDALVDSVLFRVAAVAGRSAALNRAVDHYVSSLQTCSGSGT